MHLLQTNNLLRLPSVETRKHPRVIVPIWKRLIIRDRPIHQMKRIPTHRRNVIGPLPGVPLIKNNPIFVGPHPNITLSRRDHMDIPDPLRRRIHHNHPRWLQQLNRAIHLRSEGMDVQSNKSSQLPSPHPVS